MAERVLFVVVGALLVAFLALKVYPPLLEWLDRNEERDEF